MITNSISHFAYNDRNGSSRTIHPPKPPSREPKAGQGRKSFEDTLFAALEEQEKEKRG